MTTHPGRTLDILNTKPVCQIDLTAAYDDDDTKKTAPVFFSWNPFSAYIALGHWCFDLAENLPNHPKDFPVTGMILWKIIYSKEFVATT